MRNAISLEVIDIPRPCPADWEAMDGNAEVRFCGHCQLNVYNLSAMTRDEAADLIAEKEGHLCVRLFKRQDGTVITTDCGGGWKFRAKKLGRLMMAMTAAVLGGILVPKAWGEREVAPKEVKGDVVMPAMGEIAAPTTRPTTQPTTQPSVEVQCENPPAIMGKMVAPK